LGASGEFQLDKITKEGREEGITAMDAVLCKFFYFKNFADKKKKMPLTSSYIFFKFASLIV